MIFAVCDTDFGLLMDTTENVCVCAEGYYQTAAGDADNSPVCTACPPGSITTTPNSQSISACGNNVRIIISID